MKFSFILIFLMMIHSSVFAQKRNIQFHSINSFEVISGENGLDIGYQTVNGLRFSNWFSGIGIGVDQYRYKTLPLFLDGRWFFGKRKAAFMYGEIGHNFTLKNKPGKEIFSYSTSHFKGGIYTGAGFGFQTPLFKKTELVFSFGYSYKELETKIGVVNPCLVAPCPVDYSTYNYELGRIIVRAGLVF